MNKKYDLSYPQQNIWLVENFYDSKKINSISGSLKIYKDFDINIAKKTINKFVELNDAMRIKIEVCEDKVLQVVMPHANFDIPVEKVDIHNKKEVTKMKKEFVSKTISALDNCLFSYLILDGGKQGEIVLNVHHIISDAWSVSKMGEELASLYDKIQNGEADFKEYPSYIDFIKKEIEYSQSDRFRTDSDFWKEYLKGFDEPVGLKDGEVFKSSKARRYETKLDKNIEKKLNIYCKENRLSPYTVFMTALAIYMERVTEKQDIIIGTPVLNRSNFAEKNMQGMFVSTMPIRFKIDEKDTFLELCKKTAIDTMTLFRHQKYPYSKISEEHKNESGNIDKLFKVMLSYQNARTEFEDKEKYEITWDFAGEIQDELEIHVSDLNNDGRLKIFYDYIEELFEPIEIKYLAKRIEEIIRDGIENNKTIETINIMPEEEKNKILYEFNDTKRPYPKDKTVIDLFEEQVEKAPDNIALVFEGKEMTYRELNEKANILSNKLKEYGVSNGNRVAIELERSIENIISIIATLKLGACYVPIDVTYSEERKKYISQDSLCILHITKINNNITINKVKIDKNIEKENLNEEVCILYTSGSTGNPKGVIITNRNVVRLVKNTNYIKFKSNDKVLQAGATVFDACTFEYWGALLNGSSLYLIKKDDLISPNKLEKYLEDNKITIMLLTTALLNQMTDYNPKMFKSLRVLLSGGETMSPIHVNKIIDNIPNINLINAYGPTENGTISTTYNVSKKQNKKVPIGKPISNSSCYVFDTKSRLLPMYTYGELCVGGDGVAKGYTNNIDLTNSKFIYNSYNLGRIYKTGDIVKWLPNGNIDFIGRRDNQVKIRGFRIELDEIRLAILKYSDDIKDAVVIIKDINEQKRILAYFTSEKQEKISEIIDNLKNKLPSYMIPSGIMQLENIPLNQNGKVDRKNLPEIKIEILQNENLTDNQNRLINIIQDILGTEVGLHTNLFDIGMDSLSVIRLSTLLTDKFNVNIEPKYILDNPSVYDIVKEIESSNKIKIKRNNIEKKEYNLTASQKGIFMNYMKDTEATLYNIPFEIKLDKKKTDVNLLKSSIEKVLIKHPSLFINFYIQDGEVISKLSKNQKYSVKVFYMPEMKYKNIHSKFLQPFDLINGTLFKIEIYCTEKNIYLLCDFHHTIFDGLSLILFLQEISRAYLGEEIKKEDVTFLDYIKDKYIKEEDIKYFKNIFEDDITINDMPYDRPRTKNINYDGNKIHFELDNNTSQELYKYVTEKKFTLNSVMQSVFYIVLAKYMYSEDITIGIADANRKDEISRNIMGMFVNTLPCRTKINWNKNILDYINEVQINVMNTLLHNSCTYEDLLQNIEITRSSNRSPLFDILFICQNINVDNINIAGQVIKVNEIKRNNSKFDITFEVIPNTNNIEFTVEYKTSLFNQSTIENLYKNYVNILNYILKNRNNKLKDIEMISDKEKDRIINDFNNTKTKYPRNIAIHTLFEKTVERFSNKNAIVFENDIITYKELNSKANRLARYLKKCGLKNGDVVAVMIDKSSEYMIALIGILKSGGVYMPISKDMPEERVKYVIQDAGAKLIVTTTKFNRDEINGKKIYININDGESDYNIEKDDSNLEVEITGKDKAYVMYTSGTTGVPKGIIIPHMGITRLLMNTNLVNYSHEDIMLVSGSVTFDTSGFEIWGALFYGMTLHLMEKENILNPKYYEEYINKNKITTTLIPTPIFNQLTEYNAKMFKCLKTLYICGDVLLTKYSNLIVENCPNTLLINTYGPTENSVICTFQDIEKIYDYDIPIGKVISNATCYIVDKCEKLCPIGVPGDLYTGGDGLGFGYINKKELTNEKFTNLECVGEKIYKTGDLTRFDEDGLIKFMGRIDSQIKLRGQRIEILEIQNKILEIKGIRECVIVVKGTDENKFLVAYYTSELDISEQEIVIFLTKYLPIYMIPYKFVKLDKIPLNQNGKIDRKRLPDIEYEKTEKKLPKNRTQEKILDAIKQTLNNENIGMLDNFFNIGGDSLLAMKLVGKFEELDIKLTYANIFEYPTAEELYNYIAGNFSYTTNISQDIEEYNYSEIEKLIKEKTIKTEEIKENSILLTGSTGFLGIHILANLIDNENFNVYCLVREKNGVKSKDRLKQKLQFYFGDKYDEYIGDRIIVLDGDIINEGIIKEENQKKEVIDNVTTIINSAAYVKHFGNEDIFKKVNIDGVNNLIKFCKDNNKRLVHISTISVSGNMLEVSQIRQNKIKSETVFDESKLYIGQNLNNIYIYSKFIAERNILESIIKNKIDAKIIRVGNLTGRYSDGMFQENYNENAFVNRIRALINLRVIPENLKKLELEFTPIDFTSDAIRLILKSNQLRKIYHVYNKNHASIQQVKQSLQMLGFDLQYKSKEKVTNLIKEMMIDDIKRNLISGIIQDLNENKELDYETNIKVSSQDTIKILEEHCFEWPKINNEYLMKFLGYLYTNDFFKGVEE